MLARGQSKGPAHQRSDPWDHEQCIYKYGVNLGDGEKNTVVRGLLRRTCGLFVERRT